MTLSSLLYLYITVSLVCCLVCQAGVNLTYLQITGVIVLTNNVYSQKDEVPFWSSYIDRNEITFVFTLNNPPETGEDGLSGEARPSLWKQCNNQWHITMLQCITTYLFFNESLCPVFPTGERCPDSQAWWQQIRKSLSGICKD